MINFKYCVISLNFNNYEIVREVLEKSEQCDYFLFTDNKNLTSSTWNVIYLPEFDTDDLTGIQKMHMFKWQCYKYIPNLEEYKYIFRVDGSILIKKSLTPIIEYINKYKYDLYTNIHVWRDSFGIEYDEFINVRGLNPMYKEIFYSYTNNDNIGLIETTIMIYRNCKEVFNLIDNVYKVIKKYNNCKDHNDQCYFTNVLYLMKDKLRILYGTGLTYRYSNYNDAKYMCLCDHGSDWVVDHSNLNLTNNNIIFNEYQIVKNFN